MLAPSALLAFLGRLELRRNLTLAAAIGAVLPAASDAATPAGRVSFALGDVKGVSPEGAERDLRRGTVINSGDTIRTARGRAQIRFNDGAYMSLRPDTEFRIDEYKYEGKADGSERSFFSLLRGGLRTLTGLIGKQNQDTYRLRTPVATIGIRGTAYSIQENVITIGLGAVAMIFPNNASFVVPAYSTATVNADGSVTVTLPNGDTVTVDAETAAEAGAEQTETNAITEINLCDFFPDACAIVPPCESECSMAIVFPEDAFEFNAALATGKDVTATYGSGLIEYVGTGNGVGAGSVLVANSKEFQSSGDLGWGRWNGQVTTAVPTSGGGINNHPMDLLQQRSLHYVIGREPPSMPLGVANYSLLGATTPTMARGTAATLSLESASLRANFTSGTVSATLAVRKDGELYSSTNIGGAIFSKNLFSGNGTASSASACGSSGCGVAISGLFAGVGASRAGFVYAIEENDGCCGGDSITGAVGLIKQ